MMRKMALPGIRRQGGFSMIEVLIALVVLAIGLLGLALLQTMNLRYTKSADQRTKAVNLASSLLDTMRSNRSELLAYEVEPGGFDDVSADGGCTAGAALTSAANLARWKCEVREALGPEAEATVGVAADSTVTVTVTWPEANMSTALTGQGQITLESVL